VITATADIPPDGNQVVDNTFAANGVDVGWTFPTATQTDRATACTATSCQRPCPLG
jgi:hypothetical protein